MIAKIIQIIYRNPLFGDHTSSALRIFDGNSLTMLPDKKLSLQRIQSLSVTHGWLESTIIFLLEY
jgi:hypothetical protein